MIVPVEVAKKRWCPFARVVEVGDGGELTGPFNRYHTGSETAAPDGGQARCLASHCMCWEWDESAPDQRGRCGLSHK